MAQRQAKEREFHDLLAAELCTRALPWIPPDALELSLLDLAGSLRGKHVLDLGCGSGDVTLQLLEAGASVTALDISPGMIEVVRRRAAELHPNGDLRLEAAAAESLPLADESVDLVVGKWILHHVDVLAATAEINRILRPGGRALFIENSGMNPVLSFARRHLAGRFGIPRFGTEDEHPLLQSDYAVFDRAFDRFTLHYPDFCFIQLLDRQVFRFRWAWMTRLTRSIDDLVWRRVPGLRRFSFHVILDLGKR